MRTVASRRRPRRLRSSARGLRRTLGPATLDRANLGNGLAERGRIDEARAELRGALAEAPPDHWYGAAAHLGLMVCEADADEPTWSASLQVVLGWHQSGAVDVDLGRLTELAGDRALAAGHPERAAEAWAIAVAQWTALHHEPDVARVQTKLAAG